MLDLFHTKILTKVETESRRGENMPQQQQLLLPDNLRGAILVHKVASTLKGKTRQCLGAMGDDLSLDTRNARLKILTFWPCHAVGTAYMQRVLGEASLRNASSNNEYPINDPLGEDDVPKMQLAAGEFKR